MIYRRAKELLVQGRMYRVEAMHDHGRQAGLCNAGVTVRSVKIWSDG
jgi:hypothetical protein